MAGFLETLLPGQGAGNLLQSLVSNQSLGDRVGSRAAGLVATQTHTPEPRTEAAASPVVAAWKNAKAASCPRVAAVYLPCVWNTLPAKALVAGHRALLRAWRLLPQDSPPCLGPRIDRRTSRPDLLRTAWLQVQSSGHWRAELTRPMWAQPHGSAVPVTHLFRRSHAPGMAPASLGS